MKRQTIYAAMAGCAMFCLVFYASFRYFSPPRRPVDAALTTGSVPSKAVDVLPAGAAEPAPVPAKPGQPAAPGSDPPVAAEDRSPTPTAYGAALKAAHSQASSSSVAPRQSGQDEEGETRRRRGLYEERFPKTLDEAKAMIQKKERLFSKKELRQLREE